MKENLCEKVVKFIGSYAKSITIVIAVLVFILSIMQTISITNWLTSIIVCLFVYFFIQDLIVSFVKAEIDKKDLSKKGVEIILGDWGSGKTHYFNNVYIKENGYAESVVKRVSCFSYTREEFIKQIVAMSFWNRWLSLNGMLSGYISFNWHKMLPKNKVIFIDDLERLPCDNYMANDFIGIIEELKKHNLVVIACSHSDIKQKVIRQYLEKMVDYTPIEITLNRQIQSKAIFYTIESVSKIILKKEQQESFANLFSENISGAVNLRNIKKVLQEIKKKENDIQSVIMDIINIPKKDDMSIDNIKKYYRYLKVKDQIKTYLLSYELLFAYPNFAQIVKDFEKIVGNENELAFYILSKDKMDKKFEIHFSSEIKEKDLGKVLKLYHMYGGRIGDLSKISFDSIKGLLNIISEKCSLITDDELLRCLLNLDRKNTKAEDIESYFCVENKDAYTLCKKMALYTIIKKELVNIESDIKIDGYKYNTIPEVLLSSVTGSFLYMEKIQSFWGSVGLSFIQKYNGVEHFMKHLVSIIPWDQYSVDMNHSYNTQFSILRFLSLLDYFSKSYPEIDKNKILKGKYIAEWKKIHTRIVKETVKDKISDGGGHACYLDYIRAEDYLFELNVNVDNDTVKKLKENITTMGEKVKENYSKQLGLASETAMPMDTFAGDKPFQGIKDDYESIFSELSIFEIEEIKKI